MNLFARATKFVETGGDDEDALLRDCVQDGGVQALSAVQLLAEHMYGGITFNFELKAPAAWCLSTFGERGLDALVEMATRTPTSKNVSLCLEITSSAAIGAEANTFLKDEWLRAKVADAIAQPDFRHSARTHLRTYILSIEEDEDVFGAVGSQFFTLRFTDRINAARELLSALALRSLAVSRPALTAYEQLIIASPNDERVFHSFLERYPQMLDPMAATVWSKPDLAGSREPDFVVRRTDNTYVVVEIEVPNKALMTGANQLSAAATQAIAQATDYRAFLVERFPLAASTFPGFTEPDCLVVIGMENQLSEEQRAALSRDNRSRNGLRVVGFDWLARRAEAVLRNVVEMSDAI